MLPYLLAKARHEEMLHAAAKHRLGRQAGQTPITHRPRAIAAPARRRAGVRLRLRKLFS